MKATGIVRRIDDLGRVVIPKDLRRTMNIREGDPLEIFVDEGYILFRKYDQFTPIVKMIDNAMEAVLEDDPKNAGEIIEKLSEAKKLIQEVDHE